MPRPEDRRRVQQTEAPEAGSETIIAAENDIFTIFLAPAVWPNVYLVHFFVTFIFLKF